MNSIRDTETCLYGLKNTKTYFFDAYRYCQIGTGSILRPPHAKTSLSTTKKTKLSSSSSPLKFLPLTIGNHTRIGSNCLVQSASIGSSVIIGNNVVLSNRCIIKDNVYVSDDTIIAEDTVIPPFSVVKGCPGKVVGELMESCAVEIVDENEKAYMEFVKSVDGDDGRRKR
mmetsp:Transcript_20616/g.27306  ORF Transcript_20616/g.27306 Transcript_20616/m.27306 type:complete len:170 (+) Transcript_20616:130-639(+)